MEKNETYEVFEGLLKENGYTIENVSYSETAADYHIAKGEIDTNYTVLVVEPEHNLGKENYDAFVEFFEFIQANIR